MFLKLSFESKGVADDILESGKTQWRNSRGATGKLNVKTRPQISLHFEI